MQLIARALFPLILASLGAAQNSSCDDLPGAFRQLYESSTYAIPDWAFPERQAEIMAAGVECSDFLPLTSLLSGDLPALCRSPIY